MCGARGRTRTCDLPDISRVLQPTKLPAQRQVADRPSHHKDDGTLTLLLLRQGRLPVCKKADLAVYRMFWKEQLRPSARVYVRAQ